MAAYDVFLSYSRADAEPVRELLAALEGRGLRVWLDDASIPDFAGATDAARAGIAGSRAFVAYYSAGYPRRRACQWELTQAYVAAQARGDPRRRVLVVNPEPGQEHIQPVQLREARYVEAGGSAAARIAAHVETLDGTLGEGVQTGARWFPAAPAGAPRFVGRLEDLWRVHSALSAPDAAMTERAIGAGGAVLRGIGGAGKTLLAQEYALRFAAAYPGGVFWLRAGDLDPTALEAERQVQVRELTRRLLGPERAGELERAAAEDVDALLHTEVARGERCLWIVDDVPPGLELAPWLAPEPARTLLTTRSGEYGAFTQVALGMLAADEALELLIARRAPEDDAERAAATEIVEDLGCHALAVDVAAASARFQSYSELRDGLRDLAADELELAARLRDRLPTGHERSVAATLQRSIRRLGEAARDVLELAAALAARPIPGELVSEVFRAADGLGEREARWRRVEALDELAALSLAEAEAEDAWSVHELVSRTVVAGGDGAVRRDALREAAAATIADRFASTPGMWAQVADLATHATLAPLAPHARHLTREIDDPETLRLLMFTALYDQISGSLASSEQLWRRELDANRRRYGDDDERTLRSITFLAEVLGQRGDLETSLDLHAQALASFRRIAGKDDPRTLASIDLVAGALRRVGRYDEALDAFREATEARARIMGPRHRDTLDSMGRLAAMLAELGRLDEARELAELVVEARNDAVGPDHPDTLESLGVLASILHRQGEPGVGAALHATALQGRIETLGEEHLATLDSMHDAAGALLDASDLQGARELNAHVLERRRELLGPDAPKTLSTATNLAETLRRQGDTAAARELIEDTLERSRRALGEAHPDTVLRKNNLAAVLADAGEYAAAGALLEQVLEARLRLVGETHPETLQTLGSLSAIAVHLGDLDRAIALGERAVLGAKQVLGARHPITATAFMTLVAALGRRDDAATSRAVIARVAPNGPGEFTGST